MTMNNCPPPHLNDAAGANGKPGASSGAGRAPLPNGVVEQAVAWYVRLASRCMTSREHLEFDRWRAAHPDHACAWERLQNMGGRVQASAALVAPAVTHATMARLAAVSSRRQAIKTLLCIGVVGASAYLVEDHVPWRGRFGAMLADIHTSIGERRSMLLADGTQLLLNTATTLDLRFDARERRIVLRDGEIMVATGSDPAGRPFIVETPEGTLIPVGTRFTVRYDHRASGEGRMAQLAVTEGAVQIRPANLQTGEPALIRAGQQVSFTRDYIQPPGPLAETSQVWVDGTFAAEGMRLGDFLAELNRYRYGKLSCAPEVAGLRITGAWPLDGPDALERILDSLERRLPVRVSRYTRLWVRVAAR